MSDTLTRRELIRKAAGGIGALALSRFAMAALPTGGKRPNAMSALVGHQMENEALAVAVAGDGAMTVEDKRCGLTWRQGLPDGAAPLATGAIEKTSERTITLRLNGSFAAAATIDLNDSEPEITVTVNPTVDAEMKESDRVDFPWPFRPPAETAEIVWPNRAGALCPVTQQVFKPAPWLVGGKELMMCWHGVVDARLEAGMMAIVDTPDDAELEFVSLQGLWAPRVRWLPSRGRLSYPRRVIFRFFDRGGYVAQAKRYRAYKIERGEFRTLREKARQNPWVAQLVGGINARIIHNGAALSPDYLLRLPEFGIRKGSLCVRATDDRENMMTEAIVRKLSSDGFLLTHWYTTAWAVPNEPGTLLSAQYMENPIYSVSRSGGFLTKTSKKAGGELDSLPKSGLVRLCSHGYLDKATQFIERMRSLYPLKPRGFTSTGSLKIDMLCEDLFECYDPKHPLTRTQDKAKRIETLKTLKERGFVLSAEGGNDWQVPYLDTAYDPLGMVRSEGRNIASATWAIKYPVDPKIGPLYDEYYFGAARRAPLYELVYHDCIVGTFHDGDSFNIYYKTREEDAKYWRLKELFAILHGQAPNFYLTVDKFFVEQKDRIRKTIDTVCPWHEKVGYDEMIDHAYLAPDRMVQRTRFASGWAAIVNFSPDKPYTADDGASIKPLDFLLRRWKTE